MTRREYTVGASGVAIHVVEEGPADGRPVVLLHGFPEFWWSWRHQMAALAAAGYRAVAPDLRGFGESEAPPEVADYALPNAFADVSAVIDAVGGRAAVVAHDWGGALGWGFAALAPDKVERLAVLNAPHPNVWRRALPGYLPQLRASWYMFLFQLEGVAEELLSRDGCALLKTWFYDTARVPIPDEDVARYVDAFSRPGRLTAGLNWYRANVHPSTMLAPERPELPPVSCPVLLLWGLDDAYLDADLGLRAGEHVTGPFALQTFADTGHWIQQERPEEVNRHLLDFLGADPPG